MSPLNDDNISITTPNGSIDYAYYEKQARIERSRAFTAIKPGLGGLLRALQRRLSLPATAPANGLAACPSC